MSATSTKTRSPNYPVLSLSEAIARVRTIYEKQHTHPATREVLAKLLGYGGLNGASGTVVSALSKYGLLEGRNEQLRVSALALDLILHRRGDPEYVEALQTAAFLPALFRELRDQYPGRLPSEHSLRANLVKKGFNPKAVDDAMRNYRDTIEFVDAEIGDTDTEFPDESPHEVAMQTHTLSGSAQAQPPTGSGPGLRTTPALPNVPNLVPFTLPLGTQGIAVLHVPAQLSEASWTLMMAVLDAMKPGIVTEPAQPTPQAVHPQPTGTEPGA